MQFSRIILLFLSVFAIEGFASPTIELPWEIAEPEKKLSPFHCPAIRLTGHCGNNKCERIRGESAENCSMDCAPAPISSWNATVECRKVKDVVEPQSIAELQSSVQDAINAGLRVKVVGSRHSSTNILCTDGLVVTTSSLTTIKGIRKLSGEDVVRVEAGVKTYELMKWLADQGYMLEGYPTPMFRSPTIAGALATASHGSSATSVANLTDIVRGISMINDQGELVRYELNSTPKKVWQSLTTSLGLLGIMTELDLKIRPYKNLAAEVYREKDDQLLTASSPLELIKGCDWGQFNWTPNADQLLTVCAKETDAPADPKADNVILDALGALPGGDNPLIQGITYLSFDLLACNRGLRCVVAGPLSAVYGDAAVFRTEKNGETVEVDQVVGKSYKLLTSQEPQNQRILQLRSRELIIPPKFQKSAIAMIKQYHADNRCNSLIGHYIRYSKITDASLLSPSRPGKDFPIGSYAMHLEIGGYTPKGLTPEQFAVYDKFNDDLARRLISEFGARPHWGKGENWYHLFYSQTEEGSESIQDFNEVLKKLDPAGIYSNDYLRQLGFD